MDDGNARPARELGKTPYIAAGDDIRLDTGDMPCLAREQPAREFGLKQVIGAGRAAAKMALRYLAQFKTRRREKIARWLGDNLAVLQRAGVVIRDRQICLAHGRREAQFGH